jgi:transposase
MAQAIQPITGIAQATARIYAGEGAIIGLAGRFPGAPSVQPLARLVQGRQGTARVRSQPAHDVVPRVEVVEGGEI